MGHASSERRVRSPHTGPPSWRQRAWAAVLDSAPAALSGASALRAHGVRGHDEDASIEVAIAPSRRVRPIPGLVVRRRTDHDRIVQLHLSPPRLRVEAGLLRVAAHGPHGDRAVSVLADGLRRRHDAGATRRRELEATVASAGGACSRRCSTMSKQVPCSPLEPRRYLRDVERAHRLPRASRHTRSGGRVARPARRRERSPGHRCPSRTDAWATRPPTTDGMTWIATWAVQPLGADAASRLETGARTVQDGGHDRPCPRRPRLDRNRPTLRTPVQRRLKDWTISGSRRRKCHAHRRSGSSCRGRDRYSERVRLEQISSPRDLRGLTEPSSTPWPPRSATSSCGPARGPAATSARTSAWSS